MNDGATIQAVATITGINAFFISVPPLIEIGLACLRGPPGRSALSPRAGEDLGRSSRIRRCKAGVHRSISGFPPPDRRAIEDALLLSQSTQNAHIIRSWLACSCMEAASFKGGVDRIAGCFGPLRN